MFIIIFCLDETKPVNYYRGYLEVVRQGCAIFSFRVHNYQIKI